jgi:hypothetical protein
VVGSSSSSRIGAVGREADPGQNLRDLVLGLVRPQAVEARGVAQVLDRAHLLEEARLDRDAVDHPAHRAGVAEGVPAEDRRRAAVRQQQCREQPDQRRLPRAVRAQDGDALAALDLEVEAPERSHATLAAAVPAGELLAQVVDF